MTSTEPRKLHVEPGMTPPSRLPQYNGRAVPWVTKWTGETSTDPFTFAWTTDGLAVAYPDGIEYRDPEGYLWRREGIVRTGEPQYRQVNAHRQRISMWTPRCQVCGVKLDRDKPIRWLLPKKGISVSPEGAITTHNPPTCDGCVPLARQLCPHLSKQGSDLLLVKRWHAWGVLGEVILLDGVNVVERVKDVSLEYGRTYKNAGPQNFVVRSAIAALDDYEVIE